jgi:TonB family protein
MLDDISRSMMGFLRRCSGIVSLTLSVVALTYGANTTTEHASPGSDDRIFLTSHAIREKAVFKQEPEYPPAARQFHLSGEVIVEFTVSVEGKVENVTITSGQPLLSDAVVRAVRKWSFAPFVVDGHPRRVKSTLSFDFKL